jgi:hypothetical protein
MAICFSNDPVQAQLFGGQIKNSGRQAIATLVCGSASHLGDLTLGVVANGVASKVPYTGGKGSAHNGQTVSSTGVTGLTATLAAGTFAMGADSLLYTITGTPASAGTASFALNIGGRTCTLNRTVNLPVGSISALNCGSAVNNGTLTSGVAASGVNSSISYSGGNGGTYNGQTVASSGVTGLTATIGAGIFANGAGSLVYTITGTPASGGTASFVISIGGQSCTLPRNVVLPVGTISSISCGTATNTGTLTSGSAASGVSSSIPYTGGNGGAHNGQTVSSTGVTGLTATLAAGTFANGSGSLVYTISGTPSSGGTASFAVNIGGKTCSLSLTVKYAINWWLIGNAQDGKIPSSMIQVTYQDSSGVFQYPYLQAHAYDGYIMVPGRANFTPRNTTGGPTAYLHAQNLGPYDPKGCYTRDVVKLSTCSTCAFKTFSYIDCDGNSKTVTLTNTYPNTYVLNLKFRQITSCQGGINIQ